MEKQFEFGGSKISYQKTGVGKTVVLLHGFAEDGKIWEEQVAFLQPHCQLIVPDLPGSGGSELLQRENVSIEDYAECVNALLDAENIEKCLVVGHSMGGYITLAFAEKYPGKLNAFGFVHSTAFADSDEKKNTRRKAISLIKEYGVLPFLKNTIPNLFGDPYKNEHPERVADLIEQGKNFSEEALIQYYTAMMQRPGRTIILEKSNVPVLFIVGSQDVAAPLDDLMKQVHLPKVSYIHILNQVGHMSMWECPAKLNKYLLEFIEAVK